MFCMNISKRKSCKGFRNSALEQPAISFCQLVNKLGHTAFSLRAQAAPSLSPRIYSGVHQPSPEGYGMAGESHAKD